MSSVHPTPLDSPVTLRRDKLGAEPRALSSPTGATGGQSRPSSSGTSPRLGGPGQRPRLVIRPHLGTFSCLFFNLYVVKRI